MKTLSELQEWFLSSCPIEPDVTKRMAIVSDLLNPNLSDREKKNISMQLWYEDAKYKEDKDGVIEERFLNRAWELYNEPRVLMVYPEDAVRFYEVVNRCCVEFDI